MEEIIRWVWSQGIREIVVAPGRRNAALVEAFSMQGSFKLWPWFEERSGAFFALGRARATGRPVAVLTTSGTAAGELLPAVMEGHYAGGALLLLTADRPRRYRGTGAPQTAEQVGLYGCYAKTIDIQQGESLEGVSMEGGMLHLNVACEEPKELPNYQPFTLIDRTAAASPPFSKERELSQFLKKAKRPFVIVSTLAPEERPSVLQFLLDLKAPVYLEGISGLREEPLLAPYAITQVDRLFASAKESGYPIDALLRLGGVPTLRAWRQLEEQQIPSLSIYRRPFVGTVGGSHITSSLVGIRAEGGSYDFALWKSEDKGRLQLLEELFKEEPESEPALIQRLAEEIPSSARIYIGNSLPIREWDLAISRRGPAKDVWASRGLNGIDGQIAHFFGVAESGRENWGIIGDLTALYDMAAFSIAPKLEMPLRLVVVNNGGGMIFSRFGYGDLFLHRHALSLEPLAKLWGWEYHCFDRAISKAEGRRAFIELIPCPDATERFWRKKDACTTRLSRTSC